MLCEGFPQGKEHNQRACDGRPQSRNQKHSVSNRKQIENGWLYRQAALKALDSMGNERDPGNQPQQQKSAAGPAAHKCGE